MLGVNAERSREVLRQVQEKEALPWRSLWDGPGGPIAAAWGVDGYPYFFLIDHRGAIRYQHAGAPSGELEANVEELVKEAERQKKIS